MGDMGIFWEILLENSGEKSDVNDKELMEKLATGDHPSPTESSGARLGSIQAFGNSLGIGYEIPSHSSRVNLNKLLIIACVYYLYTMKRTWMRLIH